MTRVDFLNSLCCFFLYHFVNISLCFKNIYILYSRLASFKVSKRAALIIKHTDERFYGNRTTMYYFVTCICKVVSLIPRDSLTRPCFNFVSSALLESRSHKTETGDIYLQLNCCM